MNNTEKAYHGDIHNHCNISYGLGSLSDALANAAQKLDFCSVTGHAHWCDMPEPNQRIAHIVKFHEEGFARLKSMWTEVLKTLQSFHRTGEFLTFPSFEVHSGADGDRTVVYRNSGGNILYPRNMAELNAHLRILQSSGTEVMAMPHHIGYRRGARGINWDRFDEKVSPVVEIFSMHGSSESTEGPFPHLHSMGPADRKSTVQYGLAKGYVFGFTANTDHHNAHPGSYGQGLTGVWAPELSREAIWDALKKRRTFALTGDKMKIDFELDGSPMGSVRKPGDFAGLRASVSGGGAIDYVDIIRNNRIVRRVSCTDREQAAGAGSNGGKSLRSIICLEVGWGHRGRKQPWEVQMGITGGEILKAEPRFRGADVLSPLQKDISAGEATAFYSQFELKGAREARFNTVTYGNPANTTAGTQGLCLHVEVPRKARVWTRINGKYTETPVEQLLTGGRAGHLIDEIDAPAWLLHRMPEPHEFLWEIELPVFTGQLQPGDSLYLRVRQHNGQWAWASPVFAR